ncbi:MAG: hypothetical protein ACTS4T_01205 [Candidatus Hodgkinia cicadicola]
MLIINLSVKKIISLERRNLTNFGGGRVWLKLSELFVFTKRRKVELRVIIERGFVLSYSRICSMIYHFANERITNFRLRVTIEGRKLIYSNISSVKFNGMYVSERNMFR